MWEDPECAKGGRWIVAVDRFMRRDARSEGQEEALDESWLNVVLSLIGGAAYHDEIRGEDLPVCGGEIIEEHQRSVRSTKKKKEEEEECILYAFWFNNIFWHDFLMWVIAAFVGFGAVFLAMGTGLSVANASSGEYTKEYTRLSANGVAVVEIEIGQDMPAASTYLYYEIGDFYQNHRRFVTSRSDEQLADPSSVKFGEKAPSECEPATVGSNGKVLYPCGLVARSIFNDSFVVDIKKRSSSNEWRRAEVNESAEVITWKADLAHKFKNLVPSEQVAGGKIRNDEAFDMWLTSIFPPEVPFGVEGRDPEFLCSDGYQRKPNPSGWGVENAHFVNWMRPAAKSTFRKVYGKFVEELQEGDVIRVTIFDNFPVYSFGGKKSTVVASATWFGGSNKYLSLAYLLGGGICLVFAAIFGISNMLLKRKFYDTDYRDWED
ncbi:hypothetical protein FOL47_002023 [Perkinsus chesapeaki]|uniref:Uncharacterized protein n=1 Tax=Perkinsus chesapeaki TaxID=330153 RepID=A0A7J6MGA8_PERCH|nr:hypothetical protein FOL47_002023 [Perkinsus chesapeaki]